MIKNYNSFIGEKINEANVKTKITRADLKVGDSVMTHGEHDGVNLDYQVGKILEMKDYGYILIEFDEPFSKKFHAGHMDIGKPGHCFYVSLDNIFTNNREEFEKIIKQVGEEKKNRAARLNADYKDGDVIVGIGQLKQLRPPLNIDGEVGIIFYQNGNGGLDPGERNEKNNKIYWVGFLDKFDNKNMKHDNDGLPKNDAGLNVDKLHLRHATEEEKERVKDKLAKFQKEIEELKKVYEPGTVVVANGVYHYVTYKNNIGIVRYVQQQSYGYGGGYGAGKKEYVVQFFNTFDENLYDIDKLMGDNVGGVVPKAGLREPTPEELEKYKTQIKLLKEEIEDFNYDYKIGDDVITKGNYANLNLDGQIGKVAKIEGSKPKDTITVSFFAKFNKNLYKVGKDDNCYALPRNCVTPAKGVDVEDIKRKLENRELAPFRVSPSMAMLLERMGIKVKTPFMVNTYFDVTPSGDTVSYLPIKRWDGAEDPYKSRFRQTTKVGKFLRMLNKDFTDRDVEAFVNNYKASYDICISGVSDKLRLVSGEAMRYWYNGKTYVKGGGTLNSSCMSGAEKGPEMQMFVDNPDVIQLLILTNEENKLLGRAIVWRLAEPPGQTYMDYIYVRYDKDRELFRMYAKQRGWLSADYGRESGMVCALYNGKHYRQGYDALDHFDGFHLSSDGTYLTMGYNTTWKRPNPIPKQEPEKPKAKIEKVEVPFKEGDKVVYKNEGKKNDNKKGVFVGVREADGKFKIVFDDGIKFAATPDNVFPADKENEL